MQISGYGALQSFPLRTRTETSSTGSDFTNEIRDQVTLSQAGSANVLSTSEKQYFNNSFGINVFASEKSPSASEARVVSNQAASVLDQQEINYFQGTLGSGARSTYTNAGQYGQAAARIGGGLNRSV